ncbi:P1 family peptidase [Cryptosporangium aurantiacum]|uniref:L-aminopeptidase/D-esterase n=1 Tax=Cryptosporangium aurantiacum TaxID=134849 RepID=A0A1M7HAK8_9ACTN|nr:P1 family peptidase [Cryptosporangium aurantiacum]SHM25446.1 L-aminopeptidase/D-esterase [Cryptosporangium aurantiacum]
MTVNSAARRAPHLPSDGRGNESQPLTIVSNKPGIPIEFDFPGVEIGTAEYAEGPTGCTLVYVPAGARTAVDERGGAIGASGRYGYNHGILLSGGSSHGLQAAAGVTAELLQRGGNQTGFDQLPLISGAVVYDFPARGNAIHPDVELGRAALRAAVPGRAASGRVGAGVSATVGKLDHDRSEYAGQGVAFRRLGDIRVLVVTIVNAVGVVVDRDGSIVRGNWDRASGERRLPVVDYERALAAGRMPAIPSGNTTITAVVTNVRLNDIELNQFAKQVHSSMHRAIQPFHTAVDGDILFALTTDEVSLGAEEASVHGTYTVTPTALGAVASEVAWDAVLASAK